MNIRFKDIDIESFRSIDKAKITLENQGTVIVRGVNEYEDKATSNGSGKSSVFEAIIFALFEETSSGEKDVSNRILGTGYSIKLTFEVDGNNYVIVRQSKGSKSGSVLFYKNDIDISARNKTDTNKLIEQTLGINKNIFLDSVFLSQNANTNLSTLSPTARKERLEILTNTDAVIAGFKERLKSKQTEYEAECVSSQMNINKLQGNLDTLNKQKYAIQLKINEIDEQIRQRDALGNIEDIDKQIIDKEQSLEQNKQNLQDKEKEIEQKEIEIEEFRKTGETNLNLKEELNKQINNKREDCNNLSNDISNMDFKNNQCDNEITRLNKEINEIKNSNTCPTCGRKYENINEEHINNKIKELNEKITQEQNNIDINNKEKESRQEILNTQIEEGKVLRQKLGDLDVKIEEHKKQLNEMDSTKKELTNDRVMINYNIQTLQNEINTLRNRKEQILQFKVGNKDEFVKMLENIDLDVININKQVESETNNYNLNNDYVNSIKHSLQLITKEFRTYLLQNSIKYLNEVLNKYSKQLFSNEQDLIHISDNDTKLDILLGNAPYESLSGGEKTRVNIALLLAQKSLASIIGNISCNLIILDEILGYCDNQAEMNVIDLITKELESLESIYMVSHKEIPIGYDTQLTVVKNKNGLSNIRTY